MSKLQRKISYFLLFFATLGAFGCRRSENPSKESTLTATFTVGSWINRSDGVVRVRDGSGTLFETKSYQRIVSLAPNTTEILFALGVGDRVVGVTTNCNYPPEATTKEKIGDYNLNYEKIVALKPDLAVGSTGFTDAARSPLERAGIPYYAVSHASFGELLESMWALGVLLGAEETARRIVAEFNAAVQRAAERVPSGKRLSVFWIQWNRPLSTVGPGNFHHDLIEYAGGRNIASDLGVPYGPFNEELLVERAPEVLLVPSPEVKEWAQKRFPHLPAVKKGRIYVFGGDESARPGPRLVSALETLSLRLYPTP